MGRRLRPSCFLHHGVRGLGHGTLGSISHLWFKKGVWIMGNSGNNLLIGFPGLQRFVYSHSPLSVGKEYGSWGNSGNNLLIGFLVFSVLFFAVALLVGHDDVDGADSLATSASGTARGDRLTLESRQLRLVSTVWPPFTNAPGTAAVRPQSGRRGAPTRGDHRRNLSSWTRPSLLPHC